MNKRISSFSFLLAIYSFLVPLENILDSALGGSVNKYIGICIMALSLVQILFSGNHLKLSKTQLVVLILCLYILSSFAWVKYDYLSAYFTIIVNMLAFFVIVSQIHLNESETNLVLWALVISGLVFSISMIMGSGLSTKEITYDGDVRLSIAVGGVAVDNNNLAVCLSVEAISCLGLLDVSKKTKRRFFFLFSYLLISIAIIVTGSRGGLLSLVGGTIVVIWSRVQKNKLGKFLIFILLLFAVYQLAMVLLPHDITSRFTLSSILDSGGTGRFIIWFRAYQCFYNSNLMRMLLGYGYSSFGYTLWSTTGLYAAAHNDFVQFLIEVGVVGVLLLVYLWTHFLRLIIRSKNAMLGGMLAAILLGSLSMELFIKKIYWLVLLFCVIFSVSNSRDKANAISDFYC